MKRTLSCINYVIYFWHSPPLGLGRECLDLTFLKLFFNIHKHFFSCGGEGEEGERESAAVKIGGIIRRCIVETWLTDGTGVGGKSEYPLYVYICIL